MEQTGMQRNETEKSVMKSRSPLLVLGFLALIAQPGQAQNSPDDVTLNVVKYDGLKAEVLKQRGKVVLVDIWGIT
jgi:hypothetical protein